MKGMRAGLKPQGQIEYRDPRAEALGKRNIRDSYVTNM